MKQQELKENLKVAEEILKQINIPGKKDSMLAAAKNDHVIKVGILLNNILSKTCLVQHDIDEIVTDFKEQYKNTFLKFMSKEGV